MKTERFAALGHSVLKFCSAEVSVVCDKNLAFFAALMLKYYCWKIQPDNGQVRGRLATFLILLISAGIGGWFYGKRIHNLFYDSSVTSCNNHKKITAPVEW